MRLQVLPSRNVQIASALCALLFLLANSGNPPNGRTGAPFDGNCTDCHSSPNMNYNGTFAINGLPNTILPGQAYSLTVTGDVTQGNPVRAGFQLVLVDDANANAGTLVAGGDNGINTSGGRSYIEQRGAKGITGNKVEWTFDWAAPMTASNNQIKAYGVLNLCNGSGTSGDRVINIASTYTLQATMPLGASAVVNNNVLCNGGTNGSATATASGGLMPYTFTWSNGASGTTVNNFSAGTYTVTITDGSNATSTASVAITEPSAITASVANSGSITCTTPNVALTVNTSGGTGNLSYTWSNGATTNITSINTPGQYTVTVEDASGCTQTAQATVIADTDVPTVTTSGELLSCLNPQAQITSTVTANSNVTYQWAGPNGFISNMQNPSVLLAGIYTVTVTSANGCTSTATQIIQEDTAQPDLQASGGTLDCTTSSIQLNANSNTAGISYLWSSANGFSSTLQNPTTNLAGTYTVVVVAPNGCTNSATVTVLQDTAVPDITISGNTQLTCASPSSELVASSSTTGVSYDWGNGNTSANLNVTQSGTYSVTIFSQNGCSNTESITVSENKTDPGATATGGTLTCTTSTVQLQGTSPTANANYTWTTPSGTMLAGTNPSVSEAGDYMLLVSDPSTGCTSSAIATVTVDAQTPAFSAVGGMLDCNNPSVMLFATSTTPGLNYEWSGPFGTLTGPSPVVDQPGAFNVTATNPINGCTASTIVGVTTDFAQPVFIASVSGDITCANPSVQLIATPDPSEGPLTYQWTGVGGFTSTEMSPFISAAGIYTVVATGTNGCSSTQSITVEADTDVPFLSIATPSTIDCNSSCVQVDATVMNAIGQSWTGPNGFTSTDEDVTICTPGTYVVVATASSGCTVQTSVDILEDFSAPSVSADGGVLTCSNSIIQLNAVGNGNITTYNWTGPNGFSSSNAQPMVDEAGTYTVVVTGTNGCTGSAQVSVTSDIQEPQISIATASALTCVDTCVEVTASADIAGASFEWLPSFGNPTTGNTFTYCASTGYTEVMAIAPNGCTALLEVNVNTDIDAPILDVETSGNITCTTPSVQLSSQSNPASIIQWTDPSGNTFSQNSITSTAGGTYTATATSQSNGCTAMQSIEVLVDTMVTASIESINPPSCFAEEDGSIRIQLNDSIAILDNLMSGAYVTDLTASNGCMTNISFIIPTTPEVVLTTSGGPWVAPASITPVVMGGTPGYTFNWRLDGQTVSTDSVPTNLAAGTYTVNVRDANGCLYEFGPFVVTQSVFTKDVLAKESLTVYPTPTHGILNIEHTELQGQQLGYQLFNATGERIIFEKSTQSKVQFDLSTFPEGMYLLRVYDVENPRLTRTVPIIRS